jgi:hypothetical protein
VLAFTIVISVNASKLIGTLTPCKVIPGLVPVTDPSIQ